MPTSRQWDYIEVIEEERVQEPRQEQEQEQKHLRADVLAVPAPGEGVT